MLSHLLKDEKWKKYWEFSRKETLAGYCCLNNVKKQPIWSRRLPFKINRLLLKGQFSPPKIYVFLYFWKKGFNGLWHTHTPHILWWVDWSARDDGTEIVGADADVGWFQRQWCMQGRRGRGWFHWHSGSGESPSVGDSSSSSSVERGFHFPAVPELLSEKADQKAWLSWRTPRKACWGRRPW